MTLQFPTEWPQYFTASIRNWLPVSGTDKYKNIVTDSLNSMVKDKRIQLNAFAPKAIGVDNHIQLTWQPLAEQTLSAIHLSFMKFTPQKIKFASALDNPTVPEPCKVNKTDRAYQSR